MSNPEQDVARAAADSLPWWVVAGFSAMGLVVSTLAAAVRYLYKSKDAAVSEVVVAKDKVIGEICRARDKQLGEKDARIAELTGENNRVEREFRASLNKALDEMYATMRGTPPRQPRKPEPEDKARNIHDLLNETVSVTQKIRSMSLEEMQELARRQMERNNRG